MEDLIPYQNNSSQNRVKKFEYLKEKYAYTKRDYKAEDIDACKKFAVYFNPVIDKIKDWTLIAICSTFKEAQEEIAWRYNYMKHGDTDLVLDHDERFKTFRDETKNTNSRGASYEPGEALMKLDYNKPDVMQIISSAPQSPNGFKGLCHYSQLDLNDYNGYYKIEEIYEIS